MTTERQRIARAASAVTVLALCIAYSASANAEPIPFDFTATATPITRINGVGNGLSPTRGTPALAFGGKNGTVTGAVSGQEVEMPNVNDVAGVAGLTSRTAVPEPESLTMIAFGLCAWIAARLFAHAGRSSKPVGSPRPGRTALPKKVGPSVDPGLPRSTCR